MTTSKLKCGNSEYIVWLLKILGTNAGILAMVETQLLLFNATVCGSVMPEYEAST